MNGGRRRILPTSIFVDRNNTLYVTDLESSYVKEWRAGNTTVARTTFGNLRYPGSLFVTTDGTIYVDNGVQGVVEQWALNATSSTVAMHVPGSCLGLFVDILNNLYCSVVATHQVVKQMLDTDGNISESIIAGNDVCGSDRDMLCEPRGIFVTIELDLYVADSGNHRIQLFQSEQLPGKTVAGENGTLSIRLNYPTGIVVDADDYLFIVDGGNNRILRMNSKGFYCVVGCSALRGSASDQLHEPLIAAFDNAGNILVADRNNYRVQQFLLITNTDGM